MSATKADAGTSIKPLVRIENSSPEDSLFCDDPAKCGRNHWNNIPSHIKEEISTYKDDILNMRMVVKEILPILKSNRIEDALSIGILREEKLANTAYHLVYPKKEKILFGLFERNGYINLHELLKDND